MSKTYHGIDISEHQGKVNFAKVYGNVDRVILRTGYGKTGIDKRFFEYVAGCRENGIPIDSVYHFVYALTEADVRINARKAIAIVQQAQLPKKTRIWCDVEYDTIDYAKRNGVNLTNAKINSFTKIFCEEIIAAGYLTGIYTNNDYYNHKYYKTTLSQYPIWLADYTGGPDQECIIQQYSEKGKVPGISGTVDMDYFFEVSTKTVSKATTPTFKAGKVYALLSEMKVRKGPSTKYGYKKHSELTADGQKHDKDKNGFLDIGTKISCLEVRNDGDNIWVRCPSGWIAAYYNGITYMK